MKKWNWVFAGLLLLVVLMVGSAALAADSGTCGEHVIWTLDDNGTLTISGTGGMDFWGGEGQEGFGWDREKVKKVVIKNGVTVVGSAAFGWCPNLVSIYIPASVTCFGQTGEDMYYDVTASCSRIEEYYVESGNQHYCSKDGVLFTKNMEYLLYFPPTITGRYVVPSKVRVIYGAVGSSSGALGSMWCSLTELILPEGVEEIGNGALDGSNLKRIMLPASLKYIGDYNFYSCHLNDVYYAGTRKQWDKIIVYDDDMGYGPNNLYYATIHIGSSEVLTSVGDLRYYINLKKKTAAVVGASGYGKKTLSIPASVSYKGKKYPVTEIEANAFKIFENYENLNSVTIGKNIAKIGKSAFENCEKLKNIKVLTSKLTKKGVGAGCFNNISKKATFKVPKKMLEKYREWFIKIGKAPETATFTK